jgi:hypothetical protein
LKKELQILSNVLFWIEKSSNKCYTISEQDRVSMDVIAERFSKSKNGLPLLLEVNKQWHLGENT